MSFWAPKETAMIEEMCLSVSRGEFVMVHHGSRLQRRSPKVAGEALSVSWRKVAAPLHRLEVWMEEKHKYSTAPRLPFFLLMLPSLTCFLLFFGNPPPPTMMEPKSVNPAQAGIKSIIYF